MLLLVHFFKLDTMDAIWLTIMSNQLSGAVSLPPAPTASRLLEQSQAITEGGGAGEGLAPLMRSPMTTQKKKEFADQLSHWNGEVMNALMQKPGFLSFQTH